MAEGNETGDNYGRKYAVQREKSFLFFQQAKKSLAFIEPNMNYYTDKSL
jgi:hypothetical protein